MTSAMSSGWYALVDQSEVHRVKDKVGRTMRSECQRERAHSDDTRLPEVGDRLCGDCVGRLADVGLDLPLAECLGCETLQTLAAEFGLVAEHVADVTFGQLCVGGGIRPASHDGRDDAWREAVHARAELLVEADKQRKGFIELANNSVSAAIDYYAGTLILLESVLYRWEQVITGGDYLDAMSHAVAAAAAEYNGTSDFGAGIARAQAAGARQWLQSSTKVYELIRDPGAESPEALVKCLTKILLRL